jgi:hypothetical protein
MGVFNFHRMRDTCLAGEPHAWRGFIRQYGPLARHLGQHYFPELPAGPLLCDVFREARANDAGLLREFAGSTEGEFLLRFRQWVLTRGRRHRPSRSAGPATPLTPENFWALLTQFPPLQREMILLTFRRYTPEQINKIHRFDVETAQAVLPQVVTRSRGLLGPAFRDDLMAIDHDALFAQIEQQRTDNCVPDRTYVRIVDGQISWRDKENVDSHLDACLFCLARFAEYREVFYFYGKVPPLELALAEEVAAAVGLLPEEAEKPRGLARLVSLLGLRARGVSK